MPARGWPEGRPPPVRPLLPVEDFEEYCKKKVVGFVRLKERCGPQSPNLLLRIADLRHVYYDAEFRWRVFSEEDIRRVLSWSSAYKCSFDILSSQAGGGTSQCFVLESGYNLHNHYFISGGAHIRDKFSPVNDDEYRSQFLDGDDSDYDLLRCQPVFFCPRSERAIVFVPGENGARGFLVCELQ